MRAMMAGMAALLLAVSAPVSAEQKVNCADVAAAMDESNGAKSADQIATQLKVSVAEVRKCMDKENAGFPAGDTGVAPKKQPGPMK